MLVSENYRTTIFSINPIDGASVQRASMSSNAWGYVASEIPYLEAVVSLRTVVTFVTWLISRTVFSR